MIHIYCFWKLLKAVCSFIHSTFKWHIPYFCKCSDYFTASIVTREYILKKQVCLSLSTKMLLHIFPAITFVLILFMFMEIFCLVVHWNCWLKCLRYIVTNINTVSLFKYVHLRRVSNKMLYLDRSGCICLLSCFHCRRELWSWTPTLHHSPHLELEQPLLEALLALWPSPQK